MKKSTKILLVVYVVVFIAAIIFGRYIFQALQPTGEGFVFDFNAYSIIGLVLNLVSLVLGSILFFRFINSQPMGRAVFFSSFPLVVTYGVLIFLLAQMPSYQNETAKTVSTLLNLSGENNYNTILWAVLLSIVFAVLILINVLVLCRPLNRVEKIVARLGDGKIRTEKIKVGGVRQFEAIEHGLNKINNNYFEKEKSLQHLKTESEKYIPKQFFKFLGKNNIAQLQLGNQVQKNTTVALVKLIKSGEFSSMSLEENFHFVNSYMNIASPLIRKFGGFVDKYLGEGLLAAFPNSQSALDCLHALSRAVQIKNRQNKKLPKVLLRACIDSEEVSFGIIGEKQHKIPTIVSDVSLKLDKFDQIAKLIGAKVLLSKRVLDGLPLHYKFSYRYVGSVIVDNGNIALLEDLEVVDKDKARLAVKTKSIFEKGVLCYTNGQYDRACVYMEETLKKNASDRCAYIYFNKCKEKIS